MDFAYVENDALLSVIRSLIHRGMEEEAMSLVAVGLESAYKDGYHEAVEDFIDAWQVKGAKND